MTFRSFASMAFLGAAALALSNSTFAQSRSNEIVTSVPFAFSAGDAALPAGHYKLSIVRAEGKIEVKVRDEKGETVATLLPVTRLARQHTGDAPKGSLVFDNTGGKHALSEAWFPGQDGFLLRANKDEHDHAVVDVKE